MKRCPKCGLTKPTSEFYGNRSARDGLSAWCKECTKADARPRSAARYRDNRQEMLAKMREPNRKRAQARYAADPEKGRAQVRAWRDANPQKFRESSRASKLRNSSALQNHGDWQPWWDKQGGVCVLCEKPLPDDRSKMHMDHDHSCCPGIKSCPFCRRGLVHDRCNKLLGMAKDDPDLIMTIAVNYQRINAETRARIAKKPEAPLLPFDEAEGEAS